MSAWKRALLGQSSCLRVLIITLILTLSVSCDGTAPGSIMNAVDGYYPAASRASDPTGSRRQQADSVQCQQQANTLEALCTSASLDIAYDYRVSGALAQTAMEQLCATACVEAMGAQSTTMAHCWDNVTTARMRHLPLMCERVGGVRCAWQMRAFQQFSCSEFGSATECDAAMLRTDDARLCHWDSGACKSLLREGSMTMICNQCSRRYAAIAPVANLSMYDNTLWHEPFQYQRLCMAAGNRSGFCRPYGTPEDAEREDSAAPFRADVACLDATRLICFTKYLNLRALEITSAALTVYRACATLQRTPNDVAVNCVDPLHERLLAAHALRVRRIPHCVRNGQGHFCGSLNASVQTQPLCVRDLLDGRTLCTNCSSLAATFFNQSFGCCGHSVTLLAAARLNGVDLPYDRAQVPVVRITTEIGGRALVSGNPPEPSNVSVFEALGRYVNLERCPSIDLDQLLATAIESSTCTGLPRSAAAASTPSEHQTRTFTLSRAIGAATVASAAAPRERFESAFAQDLALSAGLTATDIVSVTLTASGAATRRQENAAGTVTVVLASPNAAALVDATELTSTPMTAAVAMDGEECPGCVADGMTRASLTLAMMARAEGEVFGSTAVYVFGGDASPNSPPSSSTTTPAGQPAPPGNGSGPPAGNTTPSGATSPPTTTLPAVILPPSDDSRGSGSAAGLGGWLEASILTLTLVLACAW